MQNSRQLLKLLIPILDLFQLRNLFGEYSAELSEQEEFKFCDIKGWVSGTDIHIWQTKRFVLIFMWHIFILLRRLTILNIAFRF